MAHAEEPADLHRALFDAHPTPMWAFDERTLRFLAVNAAAEQRYGYARAEFLALSVRDVIAADEVAQLVALLADEWAEEHALVWGHRTKAGALLQVEVELSRFDFEGLPARLAVATDGIARRKAEAALRASEERLRNVLAHIPCGVFWKDKASIYLGGNERVSADRGLAVPGELVGRTDDDLATVPEEAECNRASDRKVLETGAPVLNTEEPWTLPDGTVATLLASRVPMRDEAGQVVGVLGVYQDVTDRKRLESQLRQAQKMEAIGRLAGGVAHDFNNLLTIISGNVHLLAALPPGDAEFPQLLDDIRDAAERAAALTRQLLAFGRKQPARPEVIDLNQSVSGMVGLLKRLIGERISVRTELHPSAVPVRADRGQFEQVVLNLVLNARDAMPEGGALSIATGAQGRSARLVIRDAGTGMTDEVKRHLFEPFFTTKDVGKGTGLGLATVYGIVQQAGGSIEVESALGAGSTFTILLPLCDAPAPVPKTPLPARPAASSACARRAVLLVEDEDRLRKLVRYTLEGQGYAVTEAVGGEAALKLLTPDRHYDLLITDWVMPGIDGRELAGRVRALRPHVGVVFVSGYVPDHRRMDGLAGSLFLPKPFTPLELLKVAERAVKHAKGPRPVPVGATN
jgi:two-component system, cell cycle sensor histidine kinase and response regulator CckA